MTAINTRTVRLENLQAAIREASFHKVAPHEGGGYAILFKNNESMETFFDAVTELAGILQREKNELP